MPGARSVLSCAAPLSLPVVIPASHPVAAPVPRPTAGTAPASPGPLPPKPEETGMPGARSVLTIAAISLAVVVAHDKFAKGGASPLKARIGN
jgi:hypothetical protein